MGQTITEKILSRVIGQKVSVGDIVHPVPELMTVHDWYVANFDKALQEFGVTKLFDRSLIDEILEIDYELAYTRALDLCRAEALPAGPSTWLILEGARRVIERDRAGVGVMIAPDSIFKYTTSMSRHIPDLTQGTQL